MLISAALGLLAAVAVGVAARKTTRGDEPGDALFVAVVLAGCAVFGPAAGVW